MHGAVHTSNWPLTAHAQLPAAPMPSEGRVIREHCTAEHAVQEDCEQPHIEGSTNI